MSAFASLLRWQLRHWDFTVGVTRRVLACMLLREVELPVLIKVTARAQAA
jgi:hypothetical protein